MELAIHSIFRFIRSQGDLDGACLLYALLNARQALTGRQVKSEAWFAAVRTLKNTEYFIDNTRGSEETDSDSKAEGSLALNFINALAPAESLNVRTVQRLKDGRLGKLKPSESSVIVCSNNQHWFCVVDADNANAYVACSWVWQREPQKYAERVSPELDRIFNDIVALENLEFYGSRALIVSATEP